MKNYMDGGEAIMQGFRALGVDYIMSSPGSEWGSVWEALARQKVTNSPGPEYLSCWHETLAADMAIGYTMVTGKMQVVMLHAGVGLGEGAGREPGRPRARTVLHAAPAVQILRRVERLASR